MTKSSNSFVKGMGAGMVAGAAVITAGKIMLDKKSKKSSISHATGKAFRAVGDFVEGVQSLMK